MTRIIADISVSLDGFVTGRDPARTTVWAPIGSALDAGLVDALTLHLAPIVLGAGTAPFTGGAPRTLVQRGVISTSSATHLAYDVFR